MRYDSFRLYLYASCSLLGYFFLDGMLASPRWARIAPIWDEQKRQELNLTWHRLNGMSRSMDKHPTPQL